MMKIIILSVLMITSIVFAQTSKEQKAKELIYSSGNFLLSEKNINDLFAAYKKQYSAVSDSEWELIRKKVSINELIDEVAKIYGSKFSESEINELYAFYQSDLGKKVFQNSLVIKNEIQDATSNWARSITNTIDTYLEKKGYKNPEPINSKPATPMLPKK